MDRDQLAALAAAPPGYELPDLAGLLDRPAWHRQAACRGRGAATWFPPAGSDLDAARAVCRACPVRLECGEWALDNDVMGCWAGSSPGERRRARRAGWTAAALIAWADRPPAPVYDGPTCAHCGGLLSRKDREKGAVLCWACVCRSDDGNN